MSNKLNWSKQDILITGGNGFLGKAIIKKLLEKNPSSIAVFCRSQCPELEKIGIEVIRGDIRDETLLDYACRKRTIIFHTAAKAAIWGDKKEFFSINVEGTKNVVSSAYKNNVQLLIHTSSPSAVIPPQGIENGDESLPYPRKFLAYYPETKASAERIIKAAASEKLLTVSLRPHIIWGPGDPHILPRLIAKAARHELMRIGSGKNLTDLTYIENAAYAHVLAAEKLSAFPQLSGRTYFISDGKPVELWRWIDDFLKALGMEPVRRRIPEFFAYIIANFCEFKHNLMRNMSEPRITRFTVMQLSHHHYFDISAARKDLGYEPIADPVEAFNVTVEWFRSSLADVNKVLRYYDI